MNKESITLQQIRQYIKARAALLYIGETISTKCPKCGGALKIRRVTDRIASASEEFDEKYLQYQKEIEERKEKNTR